MKSTREKLEEGATDVAEMMQQKFDGAVETIEAIRCRLDDLEAGLRDEGSVLRDLSRRLLGALDNQAKAHPLALFLSTAAAGIVAARWLRARH